MSVQKISKNTNHLHQPKKPFEMIYRQVLDKLINPDALAVYCHLSGKPDKWEINDQYIMNHFGWGRDKVRNAINCLIVNGLMKRIQCIDEKGKFSGRITALLDGYDFKEYIKYDKKIHKNLCEYQHQIDLSTENSPSPEKPSYGLSVDGQTAPIEEDIKAFRKEDKKQEREPLSLFEPDEKNKALCHDFKLNLNEEVESFINRCKWKMTQYNFGRWLKLSSEYRIKKGMDDYSGKKSSGDPYSAANRMKEFISERNIIRSNSHGSEISRNNAGRANL